jgi:hypothetical protein
MLERRKNLISLDKILGGLDMRKVGLLACLYLCVSSPGLATTLLWMDVQALTKNSSSVVMGTVTSQLHLKTHPGVPLSQVTFEISRTLKGDLEGTIVVNNPGFDGAPTFAEGDELILFIHTQDNTHVITGFQQGSFRIVTDPAGNRVLGRNIPSQRRSTAGYRSVDRLVTEILDAVE